MSSYATVEQLRTLALGAGVYEQLTDLAGGTTADDAVGQQRLDFAESEINTILGQRYKTPVDVSVDVALAKSLRDYTLEIAAYHAYMLHPMASPTKKAEKLYLAAIARLTAIAKGAEALPGAAMLPSPVTSGPAAIVGGSPRVLTDEALNGL